LCLGSKGIRISIYAIIFLSFAILFFPVQQGYGFFTLPELSEQELIELYEQEQLANAEQARDEIFVLLRLQNPYLDTPSNVIVSFEENNEVKSVKSLDRRNENFQAIKDEQLSIAEKKCKEILGGKTISNSINDEPLQKKTIHAFKMYNQFGFLNRNHDNFQNSTLLQISIAEDFRDNNWKENFWTSNPYDNNKSIENSPKIKVNEIIQNNLIMREHKEFENLLIEQILLAEKTRDNTIFLTNLDTLNPYIIENITNAEFLIENEYGINTGTPIETEKINLVLSWSDQNVVLELQGPNLNRFSTNFDDFKLMQEKLAQMELNKMLHVENSENTEPSDSEQTDIVISDYPFFNSYNRDDFIFEFNKNMQKMKAEKKFIEMYGNEIQNKDFDQHD